MSELKIGGVDRSRCRDGSVTGIGRRLAWTAYLGEGHRIKEKWGPREAIV